MDCTVHTCLSSIQPPDGRQLPLSHRPLAARRKKPIPAHGGTPASRAAALAGLPVTSTVATKIRTAATTDAESPPPFLRSGAVQPAPAAGTGRSADAAAAASPSRLSGHRDAATHEPRRSLAGHDPATARLTQSQPSAPVRLARGGLAPANPESFQRVAAQDAGLFGRLLFQFQAA